MSHEHAPQDHIPAELRDIARAMTMRIAEIRQRREREEEGMPGAAPQNGPAEDMAQPEK